MQLINTFSLLMCLSLEALAAPQYTKDITVTTVITPLAILPRTNYKAEDHHLSKAESRIEAALSRQAAHATGAALSFIESEEAAVATSYGAAIASASAAYSAKHVAMAAADASRASRLAAEASNAPAKASSFAAQASIDAARAASALKAGHPKEASRLAAEASHEAARVSWILAKASAEASRASVEASWASAQWAKATTELAPPPTTTPPPPVTTSTTSSVTKSMTMAPNVNLGKRSPIDDWVIDHLAGL